MQIRTIDWEKDRIKIIDQTQLPGRQEYLYIRDLKTLWQAIKELKIRGAPALGAAAGLGVYLGIKDSGAKNFLSFRKELEKTIAYLAASRPTARNLFWALERIRRSAQLYKDKPVSFIKKIIFQEAIKIIQEDRLACRRMGDYGAGLIKDKDKILTLCNAGILATIDYGTALGIIYRAKRAGKSLKVFVCETRPLLQGARLTTWELQRSGIETTLICDSMAAALMQRKMVDKVIVGADRIARNGDSANKIGTYNLAVLAKYHKIPFYIAAPVSTFDLRIKEGKDIPIEERDGTEVTELFFKQPIAVKGVKVFNPAFDVTPAGLISAIVSDRGIIRAPYNINIKKALTGNLK